MRQFLPINRADLLLQLVDGARLQAAPGSVLVLGCIDDNGMGVELRVLRPARRVTEVAMARLPVTSRETSPPFLIRVAATCFST